MDSLQETTQMANEGNIDAMMQMVRHCAGNKDKAGYINWLQKLVDKGHPYSTLILGVLYSGYDKYDIWQHFNGFDEYADGDAGLKLLYTAILAGEKNGSDITFLFNAYQEAQSVHSFYAHGIFVEWRKKGITLVGDVQLLVMGKFFTVRVLEILQENPDLFPTERDQMIQVIYPRLIEAWNGRIEAYTNTEHPEYHKIVEYVKDMFGK